MNLKLLLIVFVIAGLSSCTTAYKIGQTPDDVYYSPAPQQDVYVSTSNDEDNTVYNSPEDQQIRRHISNRRLRRYDSDYGYDYPYNYDPYGYGYSYYPYNYYSYGYSPIYVYPIIVKNQPTYTGPRKYNLGTYTKPSVSAPTIDLHTGMPISNTSNTATNPVRTFAKPNNTSGVGNLIRKVFSPSENSRSNSNDNNSQTRTYEPSRSTNNNSSSSSSSSSSSGSSSAPVRTFHK